MSKAPNFPRGLQVFKPSANAPSWVRGQVVVKKLELIDWLKSQPDTVRIDLKEGKSGTWYMDVNDWKPSGGSNKPSGFNSNFNYGANTDDNPFS